MAGPSKTSSGRTRILEATIALLLETGMRGTQTRAVTERAGVGTGLLNHYFRWPELRANAFAAIFDAIARDIRRDGEDPARALERFFAESFADEARPIWRLWIEAENLAPGDPALAKVLDAARRTLRRGLTDLLEAGGSTGDWPLAEPAATALRLEALRDGLAAMILSADPDVDPARAERHLRTAFAKECFSG